MKAKIYFSALFFFFLTAWPPSLPAQNELSIYHPQWWNEYMGAGTIDEAVYTLKPQGLYVEVGMYFTFSFPENYLGIEDSLEIVFDFNLPAEAIVNDSWLWVGDQIVRADIWEIWTAMQTYEEIVDRRQDPSVLFEKPGGGYQLRIYPSVELQSRRVKINYLLPVQWGEEEVVAKIPTEFLLVSNNYIDEFRILVFPDPAWQNYRLKEWPNWEFLPINDPDFGPCLEVDIPIGNATQAFHLVMDTPMQENGFFVGTYTDGETNFYQLAYFPNAVMETEKSSRVIVIDWYVGENTAGTNYAVVLNTVKNKLKEHLDGDDFFNLIIGNTYMASQSPDWLPADDASIDLAFNNYNPWAPGTNESLIQTLINAGNFIVDSGEGGEVLLVSNSDQYAAGWYEAANDALEEFQEAFSGNFPVHVCDFQDQGFPNIWWSNCDDALLSNDNCYKGNGYFNSNLAANTGGTYYDVIDRGTDLHTNLTTQLNIIDGISTIYELYTDMSAGLCYQRYPITYLGQSEYMHLPILQVGKYVGEFPMTVEFSAFQNGQVFTETFIVEESQTVQLDTLAEEAWVGNHIEMLESSVDQINQTIDLSIQHRVLSKYTAFIALDPALGGEVCFGCLFSDGGITIGTEPKPVLTETGISAFPNPFTEEIAIELKGIDAREVHIYDHLGRLVRILEPAPTVIWDGRDGTGRILPAGLYFVVVADEHGEQFQVKMSKL